MYRTAGGQLTDEHSFGEDLLHGRDDLKMLRDQLFWYEIETTYGGLQNLANTVANHNYQIFQSALLRFIELSIHFSQ
jgi:hypothetical protein